MRSSSILRACGLACLVASVLAATVVATRSRSRAECPVIDGESAVTDVLTDDRIATDRPVASLVLHEWGVFRLSSEGRVASLAELVRESPSFVHRSAEASSLPLPSYVPPPEFEICDKPVVFLHAGTTMEVRITVEFGGGRPYLHFPDAVDGVRDGRRALQWHGDVYAGSALPAGRNVHPAHPDHWWSYLRRAGASPFVSRTSGEAEHFVFYDGETSLPRGFESRRRRIRPIAGRVEGVAFQLEHGRAHRLEIDGTRMVRTAIGTASELRAELRATLLARGLTEGETDALLDTWRANLFEGAGARVLYLIPRSTYDAILPITVTPMPREMVRVGLVIQGYGRSAR